MANNEKNPTDIVTLLNTTNVKYTRTYNIFSVFFFVNCKDDVMVILVFGFSSFYQYWLLILLQYQSPWANKTHTFNLLLPRKGGWLVAALKKSTERRLVWKDAIFYWCQFSSSWWNELVKKRKVGSPTYFLLWFFSLGRRIVGV